MVPLSHELTPVLPPTSYGGSPQNTLGGFKTVNFLLIPMHLGVLYFSYQNRVWGVFDACSAFWGYLQLFMRVAANGLGVLVNCSCCRK